MLHKNSLGITLYFILLMVIAPINLLSLDTYYYWEWSRHLDLSYYDGSPMIAYFIKLSTLLFGDTLWALSMVGIVTTALTSVIIYKSARLFLSQKASHVALSLWLFSPLVTIDLLKQTTYDNPLMLFWALTLYMVLKFIKDNRLTTLFLIGVSIGLMLLSKYSGIVLVLSLLIFLISSPYRYLFKTPFFYLVPLVSVIIFSPVILWNYQHDWLSFLYQLSTHQLPQPANPLQNSLSAFLYIFLPSLNVMLIPPLLCWVKQHPQPNEHAAKKHLFIKLCRIVCVVFILFYLFTATKATIRGNWLTPFLISSALLGGYCFENLPYRKSALGLILFYCITSIGILINNTTLFHFTPSKKFNYHALMQTFNASNTHVPTPVLTSGWFEARMLFFLKNKPFVYTIDCGSQENQYALWSVDIAHKAKGKKLKEALYIDTTNRLNCVKPYFDACVRLPPADMNLEEEQLYAYKCTNGQ